MKKFSSKVLFLTTGIVLLVIIIGVEIYRSATLKNTINQAVKQAIEGKSDGAVPDATTLVAVTFDHLKQEYQELIDTDKKLQGYELLSPATFKDKSHMMVIVSDIEHYIEVRNKTFNERDAIAQRLKEKLYSSGVNQLTIDTFWETFYREWSSEALVANQKILHDTTITFMANIKEQYQFLVDHYNDYGLSKTEEVTFKKVTLQDEYRIIQDKVSTSAAAYLEVEAALNKKLQTNKLLPINTLEEYFYR